MDLYSAFKLLLRHQKLLILTPFLTMVMIFSDHMISNQVFTNDKNKQREYKCREIVKLH